MREPRSWVRVPCFVVVALAAGCSAPDDPISRFADDSARPPSSSVGVPARLEASDGSLAALTAEVRQLRVAVEALARSQAETQALAVALSAQQDRVRQLSEQLAAARAAVYDAENSRRTFADQLPGLADQLSRATDRDRRTDLEAMIRTIEAEQSRYENELQPARNRESELSRALAVEEDRWEDLLSRLQRLTQ
jgi:predicted  nucleic acid-binding Zn-ribbon protein